MYGLTIVGGRGERLKPYTDTVPKALVPINGTPLIAYQIAWMKANGVTDVVFLSGYMSEKIEEFVGDGRALGICSHYSVEETPLGRGGAIRQGMFLIPEDEDLVLVANGDILTDQSLDPIFALHEEKSAMATMMLIPYPSQYGVVQVADDHLVTSFEEKGNLPFWINGGIYLFNRDIETLLPEIGDHEDSTFPDLAARHKLAAYRSSAFWTSVESSKELRAVASRFASASAGA